MKIGYNNLKKVIFAYIGLPVVLFLWLYCKSILSLLFGALTVAAYVFLCREKNADKNGVFISKKMLAAIAVIAAVWCFFGGQGGLYYQSSDWNMRNTIFRDLINFDWPVVYDSFDKALVYYIGYWLPAALVGKLTLLLGGSASAAFSAGNIALWLWTAFGITLVILTFITIVAPKTKRSIMFIPAFLVFFSGMDIIGIVYKLFRGQPFPDIHLEWWLDGLQFSSLTTCLFWVFNQAVVPWLVILCIIKEKNVKSYVYLGLCTFVCGPIPFMGVLVYMLGNAAVMLYRAVKTKRVKTYLRELFCIPNLCTPFAFIPLALYYISNTAVGVGAEAEGISLGFMTLKAVSLGELARYIVFIMIEAGAFLLLVRKDEKGDPLYILTWITALLSPLFVIGTAYDFVMRFSIPTVMMTAVFVAKFLLKNRRSRDIRIKRTVSALCVCLALGAVTPATEFMRGYTEILREGKIDLVCDEGITLNTEASGRDTNFIAFDYQNEPFFKYFV